jgi:small subunit ribosomal protein S4
MKKIKKKFERPLRPWDKQRIEAEKALLRKYGLRRKKEIWIAQGMLRKFRRLARELAAKRDKDRENILIDKMIALGLLESGAGLDDVLSLTVERILDRRLQTIVHAKGLANSPRQARQLILHGHITIDGKKVSFPSYIVRRGEEERIMPNLVVQKGGKIAEGA